jgi:preprotein translocase subunit SecE
MPMQFSQLQKFPSKIVTFLREVKKEMKTVSWPTKQETIHYTLLVIVISFVVALFLGGFDYLFQFILRQIIS